MSDDGLTLGWNGEATVDLNRVMLVLVIVSTLLAIWQDWHQPVFGMFGVATQEWHHRDLDRYETIIACDYWDVPPAECPVSPPKPPAQATPNR